MARVEGEAEMSGLIGDRTGKTLDEMIENSREANEMFLKEIEKEKQEAERKAREEPYKAPVKAVLYVPEKEEPEKPVEGVLVNAPAKPARRMRKAWGKLGYRISNWISRQDKGVQSGIVIGGAVAFIVVGTIGGIKIISEMKEDTNMTQQSVVAERYNGIFSNYVEFQAYANGEQRMFLDQKTITLYNLPGGALVDKIQEGGSIYMRETGPEPKFIEADERWKDECDSTDCDGILAEWKEYKASHGGSQ